MLACSATFPSLSLHDRSPRLLALRAQELELVKAGRYEDAARVRADVEALAAAEKEAMVRGATDRLRNRLHRLEMTHAKQRRAYGEKAAMALATSEPPAHRAGRGLPR